MAIRILRALGAPPDLVNTVGELVRHHRYLHIRLKALTDGVGIKGVLKRCAQRFGALWPTHLDMARAVFGWRMRRWLDQNRAVVESTLFTRVQRLQTAPPSESSPLNGHELKALFSAKDGRWIQQVKSGLGEWALSHPEEAKDRTRAEEVAWLIFSSIGGDANPTLNPALCALSIDDAALLDDERFQAVVWHLVSIESIPFGKWSSWAGSDPERRGLVNLLTTFVKRDEKVITASSVFPFFDALHRRLGAFDLAEVDAALSSGGSRKPEAVAAWVLERRETVKLAGEKFRKHPSPRAAEEYIEALLALNRVAEVRREARAAAERWPTKERIRRIVENLFGGDAAESRR
jgi:hypothetical protein